MGASDRRFALEPMSKAKNMDQRKLQGYVVRMQEISCRMEVVGQLITGQRDLIFLPPTVECVYLQLRNILELIATASLVVNEEAGSISASCQRKWHAGDILDAIQAVNPDYYYPSPTRLIENGGEGPAVQIGDHVGRWEEFQGDYLTRERFTTLYALCGSVIHTPSPFDKRALVRDEKKNRKLLRQAEKWATRIVNLLAHHQFKLSDDADTTYVCYTASSKGDFEILPFERVPAHESPARATPPPTA